MVQATFLSQTSILVLAENKHFPENASVIPPILTKLSPLVRAENTVVLFNHKYGRVIFFLSVLLSNANFLKQFSLVNRT